MDEHESYSFFILGFKILILLVMGIFNSLPNLVICLLVHQIILSCAIKFLLRRTLISKQSFFDLDEIRE